MKIRTLFLALAAAVFAGCVSPAQPDLEPRTVSVAITVPDPLWNISIEEVYVTRDRLLVVSRLSRGEGMAPQVISTAKDELELEAPPLPVRHLVLGKTFGWQNEDYAFPENRKELEERLAGAKRIYPQPGSDLKPDTRS